MTAAGRGGAAELWSTGHGMLDEVRRRVHFARRLRVRSHSVLEGAVEHGLPPVQGGAERYGGVGHMGSLHMVLYGTLAGPCVYKVGVREAYAVRRFSQ